MGYLNDTQFSQFIPAPAIVKTAGTWTPGMASNVVSDGRTAGAATFNLIVPVEVMSNQDTLKGCRLKSVELLYKIATAALTSMTTVELEKATYSAGGAAAGAAAAVTIDTGHDSSAKRVTVADHRMIVTVNAPTWMNTNEAYFLYVTCDAPATAVFTLYGAVATFDLRA
jgi:hypothetical protein